MTLARQIKNALGSHKLNKRISFVNNVLSHVSRFTEKPSLLNLVRTATGLLEVINDLSNFYPDDYFHSSETEHQWEREAIRDALVPIILEQAANYPSELLQFCTVKTHAVKIVTYDSIKIGWVVNLSSSTTPTEIYVESGKMSEFKKILQNNLWKKFGTSSIVLRRKKNNVFATELEFAVDDLVDAMPSELATGFSEKYKRAFQVNENRALLLFGPPGSGKSTMARQIMKNLNLKSFRLCVEDIDNDVTFLYDLIQLLQPDSIILDDFDRSAQNSSLLEMISHIRRKVKLVIGTANHRDSIDEALLRPERFDELAFIDVLDDNIVKKILGEYAEEAFELVKTWPIVYIQEYCKRRKWLTKEEVESSFKELADRVKRLEKYNEEEAESFSNHISAAFTKPKRNVVLKCKATPAPTVGRNCRS